MASSTTSAPAVTHTRVPFFTPSADLLGGLQAAAAASPLAPVAHALAPAASQLGGVLDTGNTLVSMGGGGSAFATGDHGVLDPLDAQAAGLGGRVLLPLLTPALSPLANAAQVQAALAAAGQQQDFGTDAVQNLLASNPVGDAATELGLALPSPGQLAALFAQAEGLAGPLAPVLGTLTTSHGAHDTPLLHPTQQALAAAPGLLQGTPLAPLAASGAPLLGELSAGAEVGNTLAAPLLGHDFRAADTGPLDPIDSQLAGVGRTIILPLFDTPAVGEALNPVIGQGLVHTVGLQTDFVTDGLEHVLATDPAALLPAGLPTVPGLPALPEGLPLGDLSSLAAPLAPVTVLLGGGLPTGALAPVLGTLPH